VTASATLWLRAVVRASVALFLNEALRIPSVDAPGCRQLRADCEYLSAVVGSLGLPTDPLLRRLALLLAAEPGELAAALRQSAAAGGAVVVVNSDGDVELEPAAEQALLGLVARMRGL
jgi:hypothetical protein